jgi:bifunctional non-homologous end joining protein LigD
VLVELDGKRIEIERPEKWVWYDDGYTIMDLVKYYVAVSPWLLPYLERRPAVYEIYPGTINGPHSFEQDPPEGTPHWIKTTKVRGHERLVTYVVVDKPATLVYLVSLFMVTLHVWESTTRAIECPDFLLLDLDPVGDCTLARLARAALDARDALADIGVNNAIVKTSGARGLHVVVPIEPEHDYKTVRAFTEHLARDLAAKCPDRITAERDVRKRPQGTVYVDWGQMGRGMTIVPPFSARACDGAPVSMPITWSEVERYARSRSKRAPLEEFRCYNIANVVDILKENGDPWAERRPVSLRRLSLTSRTAAGFVQQPR